MLPSAKRRQQVGQLLGRQAKQKRTGERACQQQRPESEPVAEDLRCGDALVGDAADEELVEHSVGPVRLDQALDGKERGGKSRNPQHPGGNSLEQPRVRPDGERDQRRNQQEEGRRKPGRPGKATARLPKDKAGNH
jgi:hypothetical protein